MDKQRLDDQRGPICNSSVSLQDVALKTYHERWTIKKDCGRRSGRSVLVARNDDIYIYIYIYIYSFMIYTHTLTHTHIYIYIHTWCRKKLGQ